MCIRDSYNSANDEILTIYLSEFPGESVEDYFQASFFDVNTAMVSQGLTHNEDLSSTCGFSNLADSLLSSLLVAADDDSEGDKEIVITPTSAAVFTGAGNRLSVLTVHETNEHEFLKYRYSLAGSTEGDTEAACEFLNEQSKFHKKNINEAKGVEKLSDKEHLLQLIDALETSEE